MRAIALLLTLTGCGALSFDVDQDLPEQRIQGSPLGALLPSFLAPIPLSIDVRSETQKRSTGPATSANLKSLSFAATPHAMPSGSFDFGDEIHITVAASGLPTKEIATLKPVPKGQAKIDLTVVPGIDLLPYLKAGATISATASGHQPSMDFTFDGHVTVTIHV